MNSPSPTRKARTIFCAVVLVAIFLWVGAEVVVISGTKSTFSFVTVKAPLGGPTSHSTTTSKTTSTPAAATTAPASGAR